MNNIIIYGPGCAKCTQLLENTKLITAQLGGEFTIQKVSDSMQFATADVFMTPALSLNGKLLFSGRNPSKEELKDILVKELNIAPSCCCSGKTTSCCGGTKQEAPKPCACKKLILWAVIIVIALAVIKTINRGNKETPSEAAVTSTVSPVAAYTLSLSYYKLGVECITCQRMDQWIHEAITANFADQIESGELQIQSVKPSEEQVQQYQLTTKTLIASKGDKWSNLDQIWALKDDEEAFKAYIVRETEKLLK